MQRLLFLSIISGSAVTGCGDDSCGPMGAPASGLVASSADVMLTYGNFSSGANNDCPDAAAPAGVVSLTITGAQVSTSSLVTFCVPRPDQLASGVQLGSGFRIIDFNGEANGCTYTYGAGVPSGTVQAEGICDNGTNKAGYALIFNHENILLHENCQANTRDIPVQLDGTIAVTVK